MALKKCTYCDNETVISAENMNDIQDSICALERAVPGTMYEHDAYGLPVLALTGDTSAMTKDNAVTLDYVYGERTGSCTVKWQGNTSLQFPKKNYTVKFDQAFEAAEGWGEQKKYCLKADFIDFSHTRNVVSAKLWGQIVRSRTTGTIEQIKTLPNGGAVDGFPCVITINGEFHGVYNFNIPKDGWMFGMGTGTQEAILCAENYFFDKAALVDGNDLELEYVSDETNTGWVTESLNRLVTAIQNSDGKDIDTTIAQYLDIDSAIDYLIFTVMNYGTDNTGKNYILATYDGVKWFFSAYDMDGTWGLRWDGKTFFSANIDDSMSAGSMKGFALKHTLMNLLYTHKYSAIQKRYWQLRSGALSDGNVEKTFIDYASRIHRILQEKDARLWPAIPSTETNDVSQIIGWFHTRRECMDADVGQHEETGVTYYPDINGFVRMKELTISTSANYRRTDYLPLEGILEIEYLAYVALGCNVATWALFDKENKNMAIAVSQDELGDDYYITNNNGNRVPYGFLKKTLSVTELLDQYPNAYYIVFSANHHSAYENSLNQDNMNVGWSTQEQYITLRSVSSESETDAPKDAVLYIPQSLTEEQKAQARANIGIGDDVVNGGGVNVSGATPGQMIIVKAVDKEGKPTEWEAVDRTHYSEYEDAVIYSGTNLAPDPDMGMCVIPEVIPLVAGIEYTVNYNGTDFVCTCVSLDGSVFSLGNMGGVEEGFENTGEPFVLASYIGEGMTIIVPLDGSASVTVTVSGPEETVYPLPKKYLPELRGQRKITVYLDDLTATMPFKMAWELDVSELQSALSVNYGGRDYSVMGVTRLSQSAQGIDLQTITFLFVDQIGDGTNLIYRIKWRLVNGEQEDISFNEKTDCNVLPPSNLAGRDKVLAVENETHLVWIDHDQIHTDGFMLYSPNGSRYTITVADDGTLVSTKHI